MRGTRAGITRSTYGVRIEPDLQRRVRVFVAERGTKANAVVERALKEYLDREGAR
jgi:predicted transcriptional regulator